MIGGEPGEFPQPGMEERSRSSMILATIMVEGGRYLDNSLQKSLLRLRLEQPDGFPGFMSFEELAGVELFDPPLKFFLAAKELQEAPCIFLASDPES